MQTMAVIIVVATVIVLLIPVNEHNDRWIYGTYTISLMIVGLYFRYRIRKMQW